MDTTGHRALRRRGLRLEYGTLAWNVVGVVVLAFTASAAGSVALAGFGFDSVIEIGASTVVIWELSGTDAARQRFALRLIAWCFVALAIGLAIESTWVLATAHEAARSPVGIAWTTMTALAMFGLAAGKARTGTQLGDPVLQTEGRVTLIDGVLATAVLVGLVVNAAWGWWWADPLAGFVVVGYAAREARTVLRRR